jgi:hypothetical protein
VRQSFCLPDRPTAHSGQASVCRNVAVEPGGPPHRGEVTLDEAERMTVYPTLVNIELRRSGGHLSMRVMHSSDAVQVSMIGG